jgi:hypothetical protein
MVHFLGISNKPREGREIAPIGQRHPNSLIPHISHRHFESEIWRTPYQWQSRFYITTVLRAQDYFRLQVTGTYRSSSPPPQNIISLINPSMFLTSRLVSLLGFASTVFGHGYVSGIVADGKYTEGWQVSFWYDIVNKVAYPQTPGWYEEALDLGFVPPTEYQ